MLVHSSTMAPMSGWRDTSARPASRMSGGGQRHVHVLLLAADQHAEELAAVLGADERRVGRHAGGGQMPRRQRAGGHGDDADALARRQHRLHPGHLDQRAGGDRHPHMRRQLRLEQRQEAAVGGDRLGAVRDQFGGGGQEVVQQARRRRSAPRAPGVAPRTTRYSTGNGQVAALPMSPGMRGNRASSIRMPSGAP